MQSLALVVHVLLAIGVIGLVLIQHGKGADAGAAFGSGASATVFGSRGSASFLTRATTVLAGLFFLTSLSLFYIAAHRDRGVSSVTDAPSVVDEVPAAPASEGDLPGGVDAEEALPAAPRSDAGTPEADAAGSEAAESGTPAADDLPAPPQEGPAGDEAPAAGDLPPPAD